MRQEFPPVDPAEYTPQEMVSLVTRRFLRYCLDNEQDEERLRALALLRRRDDEALHVVWHLPEDEQPRQQLLDLEARYGFMQGNGTMHDVVRQFLRDNLRGDDQATALRLGALLSQHYQQQWQAETDRAETLADLLAEERWRILTLDYLNALCWHDEDAAISFLVPRCLEALIFRPSFAQTLLNEAVEFRQSAGWWRTQTSRHYETVNQAVAEPGQVAIVALGRLGQAKNSLGLERGHECLLLLAQARQTESLEAALNLCLQAERLLPADNSIHQAVAQMFGEIGSGLGFKGGVAIASPLAKQAYQQAVQLAPDQASHHNGLGAMIAMLAEPDHLSLAQASYTQAIELNPDYAIAYNNRGITYDDLGQYEQAIADYTQAIELNPDDATAYNNRGITYNNMGQYEQAIADYTQAMELNPDDATAVYTRGIT
jgi:tetratricopeptide (TPR) repeat protein